MVWKYGRNLLLEMNAATANMHLKAKIHHQNANNFREIQSLYSNVQAIVKLR